MWIIDQLKKKKKKIDIPVLGAYHFPEIYESLLGISALCINKSIYNCDLRVTVNYTFFFLYAVAEWLITFFVLIIN